jgi:branched-chain amino acid transport system substrate-binding protein
MRGLCALLLAALALLPTIPAHAQDHVIPVILPMSGNAAFIGQARRTTLELMQQMVNQTGGIDGHQLRFEFHDDQTTPQVTVQITNEVMASHPSVLLGSSITGMCNAEMPLVGRNGPFTYCFSPGVHPPEGNYMVSAGVDTHEQMRALFRYFHAHGLTRIATISSTDATGQEIEDAFDSLVKLPDMAGMEIVARTRFNLNDVSVSAQLGRIQAAQPQAMIAWTTGTAVAGIFKGMIQLGLDVPVATSNGNMSNAVMHQFQSFLPKQLLIPSPIFLPHEGLYQLDPRVEAKQAQYYEIMRKAGLPIDYLSAAVWDSTLLVVDALHQKGETATASQVHDYIANLTDFAGISGLYDFKRTPQRGLDVSNAAVNRWDAARDAWVPVSAPGGLPLASETAQGGTAQGAAK